MTPPTMYVTFSLHGGGAERLLTNITLQQRHSREITVVVLRPDGVFRPALEEAGIRVVDLGMHGYHDVFSGIVRLARWIRRIRPGVVHAWDYFANILAFFACKLTRSEARLFWGLYGTGFGPQKTRLPFSATVLLNILLSRHVDGVSYNAVEARDYHHALGFRERRSIIISNSIDAEAFRHDVRHRERIRRDLGIGSEEIVVAIVARVDPMKDWPSMLAAVRGLPVITLAIGQGTETLPQQDGLHTLGWHDDVASVLSAADIFLLGSAYGEGTSLALGEAMLCGVACVVTGVGDNGTLVGDCGIVVPPRDVSAMREAIAELAGDAQRRESLSRCARARAALITLYDERMHRLHDLSLAEAS